MKVLTGYNQDIQRFIIPNTCTTEKKDKVMDTIRETVNKAGKSFEKLFPQKTKRNQAMDYILFLVSGTGICKVSAKKIAEKAGCSVRTVSDAVKNLKETGEIIVAGLADGDNKYVFVYKKHPNFQQILKEVFFIDELPAEEADESEDHTENDSIAEPVAEVIAEQVAEPKNSETLDTVSVEGGKTSSNCNNFFNSFNSFKQERNIIKDSIENEYKEAVQDQKTKEYRDTYYTNEHQHNVHGYIVDENNNIHAEIKSNASVIGLRVGSNATSKNELKAIQTVHKIDAFIRRGGVVHDGVPALFTKVYQHGLQMWEYEKQYKQKKALLKDSQGEISVRSVPLWNWLEDDGQAPAYHSALPKNVSATKKELDEMGVF